MGNIDLTLYASGEVDLTIHFLTVNSLIKVLKEDPRIWKRIKKELNDIQE